MSYQQSTKSNSINPINSVNSVYLSIVIPVYNEQDNAEILYNEIRKTVDLMKKVYEIIFVDDGSSDSTFQRISEIIQREKKCADRFGITRLIKFSRNFGQTAAMQAGFDRAIGEVIISLDGDLQNDPRDIPKFIEKIEEGYDVVCGWRKNRQDKALTRILPSKVANWIIGKVTGVPIHDNGCSLKAYRSSVIKSVRLYSDMHRFIPAVTTLKDAKIAEIVVNHRPRQYGQAKYGLSRVWKVLSDIVTIKLIIHFYNKPLLWFAFLVIPFFVCGIGLGILSILTYIQGLKSIIYPAASFLFLALCGSFLSWGLLAEYLISQEKR